MKIRIGGAILVAPYSYLAALIAPSKNQLPIRINYLL